MQDIFALLNEGVLIHSPTTYSLQGALDAGHLPFQQCLCLYLQNMPVYRVCVCACSCVWGDKRHRTCMLLLLNATRNGRLPLIPGFRQLLHPELQGCRKRSLLFPQDARRKTRFCMLTVHATIFFGGGGKKAFETRTFLSLWHKTVGTCPPDKPSTLSARPPKFEP